MKLSPSMKSSRKKASALKQKPLNQGEPALVSLSLSRRKLWFFRFLVLSGLPLILFGMIELILRLVGFRYPTGFFLPMQHDGQQVLVQNNQFGWRFFGAAMAPMAEPHFPPQTQSS